MPDPWATPFCVRFSSRTLIGKCSFIALKEMKRISVSRFPIHGMFVLSLSWQTIVLQTEL
jgi:hypothetical protein